jgi:FkbM family methyltransferase
MSFADLDIERLQRFKAAGFSPTCIFDVGASNGGWTWMTKDVFPGARFHLFEPLADWYAPYRDRLGRFHAAGWPAQVHVKALGAAAATSNIGVDPDAVGSSLLVRRIDEYFPNSVPVVVDTIDAIVARGDAPVPQLIKMDTQGGELQALQGAVETLRHVDLLLLETWLVRSYGPETPLLPELANWLARHDFFMLDLGDCYRDPNGTLTAQDVFFVNANTTVDALRGRRSFSVQ